MRGRLRQERHHSDHISSDGPVGFPAWCRATHPHRPEGPPGRHGTDTEGPHTGKGAGKAQGCETKPRDETVETVR